MCRWAAWTGAPVLMDHLISRPEHSLITALTIAKNAAPETVIAVHAAGMGPYFSRRRSIDMLGKVDSVVARLPAVGSVIGHNKLDPGYSLGRLAPDAVALTICDAIESGATDLPGASFAEAVR